MYPFSRRGQGPELCPSRLKLPAPFLRPLVCGGPRHRAQGLQPTAQGISAYRDPGGISCSGEVYRSLLTLLFTSPRRGLLFSCARGARLPSKRRRGDPMHQCLLPFPPPRRSCTPALLQGVTSYSSATLRLSRNLSRTASLKASTCLRSWISPRVSRSASFHDRASSLLKRVLM